MSSCHLQKLNGLYFCKALPLVEPHSSRAASTQGDSESQCPLLTCRSVSTGFCKSSTKIDSAGRIFDANSDIVHWPSCWLKLVAIIFQHLPNHSTKPPSMRAIVSEESYCRRPLLAACNTCQHTRLFIISMQSMRKFAIDKQQEHFREPSAYTPISCTIPSQPILEISCSACICYVSLPRLNLPPVHLFRDQGSSGWSMIAKHRHRFTLMLDVYLTIARVTPQTCKASMSYLLTIRSEYLI